MLYNRGYGSVEYRTVEDLLTIAFSAEPALPTAAAAGRARGRIDAAERRRRHAGGRSC